jgi:hypothetical protein
VSDTESTTGPSARSSHADVAIVPAAAPGRLRACTSRFGGARIVPGSGAGTAVIWIRVISISTSGYANAKASSHAAAGSVRMRESLVKCGVPGCLVSTLGRAIRGDIVRNG